MLQCIIFLGGTKGLAAYFLKFRHHGGGHGPGRHRRLARPGQIGGPDAFFQHPAHGGVHRIGTGPWYGAKGGKIADNVAHLHGDTLDLARAGNALSKATAFSEKGEPIKATGDTPNQHDILTGSTIEGKAFTDAADHTCKNWTSSATDGVAQLGHFDRTGGNSISWVAAHPSRGCSQENLIATGGNGLFYCFAVDAK